MRFRRHVPRRARWLDRLKGRLLQARGNVPEATSAPQPVDPEVEPPVAAEPDASPAAHQPPRDPAVGYAPTPDVDDESWSAADTEPIEGLDPGVRAKLSTLAHFALTTAVALVGTFVLGYLIAALVLFPAPIFATTRTVPRLLGLARSEAETRVADEGLRVSDIEGVTHPTASRGQVVWQDPPAGVGVPEGTLIRLTVSNGPQRVPVPDLLGYHATVAGQLLEAAGLEVGRIIQTQAPVPRGVVVSTRPSTGSAILPSSSVTLVVSVGAPTITVPDLTGLTQEEAEMILQQVGLTLGTTLRQASRNVPPGTIVEQDPAVGTLSAPGTVVNIFIARAPSR
ncbi:MAG: PASTA domain-containing protein [Gemmatimonadales bacterium]